MGNSNSKKKSAIRDKHYIRIANSKFYSTEDSMNQGQTQGLQEFGLLRRNFHSSEPNLLDTNNRGYSVLF